MSSKHVIICIKIVLPGKGLWLLILSNRLSSNLFSSLIIAYKMLSTYH